MTDEKKHLHRLDEVWIAYPTYFLTVCVTPRNNRLANEGFHSIAIEVWQNCQKMYGWAVGRYVVMPDHVHFFAADGGSTHSLSEYVGKWKEWTAKYAARRLSEAMPLWQPGFFDHLLRSTESYEQKWEYVRENPVRAGLVLASTEWKFQGELNEICFD
jgi:putative transposase